jgi:hypothetical protein
MRTLLEGRKMARMRRAVAVRGRMTLMWWI